MTFISTLLLRLPLIPRRQALFSILAPSLPVLLRAASNKQKCNSEFAPLLRKRHHTATPFCNSAFCPIWQRILENFPQQGKHLLCECITVYLSSLSPRGTRFSQSLLLFQIMQTVYTHFDSYLRMFMGQIPIGRVLVEKVNVSCNFYSYFQVVPHSDCIILQPSQQTIRWSPLHLRGIRCKTSSGGLGPQTASNPTYTRDIERVFSLLYICTSGKV